MTLRRHLRSEYDRGRQDSLRYPVPDPGVPELGKDIEFARWAYQAGWRDGKAALKRQAELLDELRGDDR